MTYSDEDTEKYRQLLEARARIFYSSSELELVLQGAPEQTFRARLILRAGAENPSVLGVSVTADELPSGASAAPERALEDFESKLREREVAAER